MIDAKLANAAGMGNGRIRRSGTPPLGRDYRVGTIASAGWIRTYDQPVSSVMMAFLQVQRSHP
jgi:hypothetical protein